MPPAPPLASQPYVRLSQTPADQAGLGRLRPTARKRAVAHGPVVRRSLQAARAGRDAQLRRHCAARAPRRALHALRRPLLVRPPEHARVSPLPRPHPPARGV